MRELARWIMGISLRLAGIQIPCDVRVRYVEVDAAGVGVGATMLLACGPAVMIVLSRTSIVTVPSFVAGSLALSLLARIRWPHHPC